MALDTTTVPANDDHTYVQVEQRNANLPYLVYLTPLPYIRRLASLNLITT